MPTRDIVDNEPSDGNVLKMLLGSINPWLDGDNAAYQASRPVTATAGRAELTSLQ